MVKACSFIQNSPLIAKLYPMDHLPLTHIPINLHDRPFRFWSRWHCSTCTQQYKTLPNPSNHMLHVLLLPQWNNNKSHNAEGTTPSSIGTTRRKYHTPWSSKSKETKEIPTAAHIIYQNTTPHIKPLIEGDKYHIF